MKDTSMFKAYDIRGVYPEQINKEFAYKIGQSFAQYLKTTSGANQIDIVVGRDNRLSSPELFDSLVDGITSIGVNVIDLGLITTPMMHFGSAHYNFSGGIMITASHNPAAYNGFKFVRSNAIAVSGFSGLDEVKELFLKNKFEIEEKGRIATKDISDDYIKASLKNIDLESINSFRIGIDTANAVPGIIVSKFFSNIDIKAEHYFRDLDGEFPNHQANPIIEKNIKYLSSKIQEKGFDLGVAFDGDGDRISFLDEHGKLIRSDIILCLMADILLQEDSSRKIIYDLRSTNTLKEVILKRGGIPFMSKVGYVFIKDKMRTNDIYFGGETSGHFFLQDMYYSEAPFFVILKILIYLSKKRLTLSEAVLPYQKYFSSGDINLEIKDQKKALKLLEEKYSDGKILKIDGIRVDYSDWWFIARASNTEPLLRLVLEAKTKDVLDKKVKEIMSILQ